MVYFGSLLNIKDCFLSKDLVLYGRATSMEKTKRMFTYSMDRALTFFKGDNSGTVNKFENM